MSLIKLEIPDDDGWQDILAARVLALVLGAVLLRSGLRMWGLIGPKDVLGALPTLLMFGLGVQIMVLSVADIDYERWGRPIGYGTTVAVALLSLAVVLQSDLPRLGSDVIAFTSYTVELVADGQNPFAASMAGAHALPGAPDIWTLRTDGSRVVSWSYPGGTLWAYLPQYLAIGRFPIGLRLTSLVGVVLVGLVVTYVSPPVYGLVGPASVVLAQNQFMGALGGLNDMFWVLPVVVTVWLWATDRRVWAAAVFGIACSMKQQPWAIGLPLAIWVWEESPDWRVFGRRAATYIGVGLATFTALNLPWLVVDPGAWLGSVLTPLSTSNNAPLVSRGVGVAILNQATDAHLVSRSTFEMFIYVAVAVSGLVYWRFFESLRWAAWVLPAVIFLFTPRSLPSYFHWFVPVAVVALFAAHGELRGQREAAV